MEGRDKRTQAKMLGPDDRVPNTSETIVETDSEGLSETELLSQEGDEKYLKIGQEAYSSSENWFDTCIRREQEENARAFRSEHPRGSKYHTEQYRKKSNYYRPRTRTSIRKGEAATAIAFFSTSDVVYCEPVDERDKEQKLAADLQTFLLNYRLEHDILWYQTVIGAAQSARSAGVVCSRQDWRFSEREYDVTEQYEDMETGETRERIVRETLLKEDKPSVTLIPIENMRWDPSSDWRDPINTSPYVIELIPMYVYEIEELIEQGHYREYSTETLTSGIKQDWDSIRKARDGDHRLDSYQAFAGIGQYQIVWVHRVVAEVDGLDMTWDTIGTSIMLSKEVQELSEAHAHGLRPWVLGTSNIEAHRQYPSSDYQLTKDLQSELNDVANLRMDNVRLAMNKRFLVARGRGVDIRSLTRNIAGSATPVTDIERDVKVIPTDDVTGSSYREQDYLNADFDSLLGNFDGASVQTNRRLNETVGGMQMLGESANEIKEFSIRTFSETWVEPVLKQLAALEAVYETDTTIMRVAASNIKGLEGAGMEQIFNLLATNVKVKVNVGFNSTNPSKRIEKLALAFDTVARFAPHVLMQADVNELIRETFGAVGHKDGSRFFPGVMDEQQNPQVQALEQKVQELEQTIQTKQVEGQTKLEGINLQNESRERIEQMRIELERFRMQAEDNREAAMIGMKQRVAELDHQIKLEQNDIKRREMFLQREALSNEIRTQEREYWSPAAQKGGESEGAMDLPGDDRGGTISRNNYGSIPGAAG